MLKINLFRNTKQKITSSIFFVIFLIFSLYQIIQVEKKVTQDMFEISTVDLFQITQNNAAIIQKILENNDNYIQKIQKSLHLQNKIEENIKLLITNNIKYAYILYKDKKDKFRFLVDASAPNEKAFINQKFDIDSPLWFKVYKTKKPQLIKHEYLKTLSLSYIVPILKDDSVELLLVIDFSLKKVETINDIINLMKKGIIFILLIILIFSVIFIYQKINYNKVKKSAFIDTLTNVYNRNYLQENQDNFNLKEYAIAVIDIDHFKNVNDMYGHNVGDIILRETAKIISNTIRIDNNDVVIRYGGEEFIMMIHKSQKNQEFILKILNRILKTVEENQFFISPTKCINITVSIGVNLEPNKAQNFTSAFKKADDALYKAKNSGRNNIKVSLIQE